MLVNVALHVLYVLRLTVLYVMLLNAVRCYGVLSVQKMNQIPCTGCYGNRKGILECLCIFLYLCMFYFTCNKYCSCKKQVK